MTKVYVAALMALIVVATGACVRPFTSSPSSVKINDLFGASPSSADAKSLLGGGEWWTSAPTFAARPLNAASATASIQYQLIRRYANVGTAETWRVVYTQFDTSSSATTVMSNIQSGAGNGASGPNVGDKVLYYGLKLSDTSGTDKGAAPYETLTVIRVGALVIESTWDRKDGFPTITQLGKVGSKLVSRLRDALAGKIHGAPVSAGDLARLPPPNADITLLGVVKLPIEAAPLMLNAVAPTAVARLFTDLGVNDFLFGDYALDQDTHMEVQVAVFNFSSAADAKSIFDVFRGTLTPDPRGLIISYNDSTGPGQYDIEFVSGTRVGLMICRSSAEDSNEAASRACETPIEVVSSAWAVTLNG